MKCDAGYQKFLAVKKVNLLCSIELGRALFLAIKISVQFIELLILLTCFCLIIKSLTLCPSLLSIGVSCKFGFDERSMKKTVVAV